MESFKDGEEVSLDDVLRKRIPGSSMNECKGPGAGTWFACLGTAKKMALEHVPSSLNRISVD